MAENKVKDNLQRLEKPSGSVELPVIGQAHPAYRPSRMGRRRATVLILLHVLIIAHIIQWLYAGRTVSPVEPSEAMYTITKGELNAGAIFFMVALLATLILGRFVCGWACHLVALQDLCGWMLKKIRVRPRAFRSRFLYHAPLALAIYMFIWPVVVRWWRSYEAPDIKNHLITANFWETFPGWGMGIVSFLVCGFLIVYFLGSKGFCTYGCPYGGFFAPLDKISPGRIRVTDACKHCGHCTAACTSNVRVHEEVAAFGMVVNPGCMKCMDCVSVCPNDALYYGFGMPALGASRSSPAKAVPYEFSLGEEVLLFAVGLTCLFIYRGLYDAVPLLLTMGISAIIGFWTVKFVRLIRHSQLKLQNFQLKRGGKLTGAAGAFAVLTAALYAFTIHSGVLQYHVIRAKLVDPSDHISDRIWMQNSTWWQDADEAQKYEVNAALDHYEAAISWGMFPIPSLRLAVIPLYLAQGKPEKAEKAARYRARHWPQEAESHAMLASVLRSRNKPEEAEAGYRTALDIDPCLTIARARLAGIYETTGRVEEALQLYVAADAGECGHIDWTVERASLLNRAGRTVEAIELLLAYLEVRPAAVQSQFALGTCYLSLDPPDKAAAALRFEEVVRLAPRFADGYYNLGVARFMSKRVEEARDQVARSIELDPGDPQKHGFMSQILLELGDTQGAGRALEEARRLAESGTGTP